jgi:CheY-like chemotaxis protein
MTITVPHAEPGATTMAPIVTAPPPRGATSAVASAAPSSTAVAAPIATSVPGNRRGKVLVIDDEPLITRVLQKGLTRHDVVVANQAGEALARIAGGEQFDVILCDLMMPEISGIDVHELLMREQPTLACRVVFMTGGAFTAKARQFLSRVPNPRIDKPFSLAQIAQLLDRQLATPSAR